MKVMNKGKKKWNKIRYKKGKQRWTKMHKHFAAHKDEYKCTKTNKDAQ